ncbi:YbaB/EbfC family nucleoid-associated protein [Candidatus Peregrinibacteria bacterium]|jgi:nucleoid-associated protein EbfC|nr:YbaB/EbfC family nucleoid-associated protein [Candidatus Peregrinibacteria bacterium]MBT4632310.1 YbaB/EbfC family nucleoid-associated protein [Candidatus Peregrinibacteria bacterium]MBT5516951.1 YbaB/EbfC family nucleoid-associated protein [Candidatus Peregrinibacteria bacterium]
MGLFGQAKDLYKLQKQAKKIKEELKNLHIEADSNGVTITINGEQEVLGVKISDEAMTQGKEELQKNLVAAFNKAIKKAQEVAAERMRGMMGDMGMDLPGLAGGGDQPKA